MKRGAFDRIIKRTPKYTKIFVSKSLDVAEQIQTILDHHPTIKTQKDLATALGKKESEISRWLSGLHNFTLKSIAKIEAVLDETILFTPLIAKEEQNTKPNKTIVLVQAVQQINPNLIIPFEQKQKQSLLKQKYYHIPNPLFPAVNEQNWEYRHGK